LKAGRLARTAREQARFMLDASLLLGRLRYHVQEYNRAGARLHSALRWTNEDICRGKSLRTSRIML